VIDELSWEEVAELQAYWRKVPSFQTIIRAFCGWEPVKAKPSEQAKPQLHSEADLRELIRAMNGGK
jgi:hypothetical protein